MSLLKDARGLLNVVRDDEQARGYDIAFSRLIERLAEALEKLEEQVDNKIDKPYER